MSTTIFEIQGIIINICLTLDYKSFNQFICTCRCVATFADHPRVWISYLKQLKDYFNWWHSQCKVAYVCDNYDIHFETIFGKLERIINSNPTIIDVKQAYLDLKSEFSETIIMLDDYLAFDTGVYVALDTSFFVGKTNYLNILKSLSYWPPPHYTQTSGPLEEAERQFFLHSVSSPIDLDDETVVIGEDTRSTYYHSSYSVSPDFKDSFENGMDDPELLKIIYDHLTQSPDLVYSKLGYDLKELALAVTRRYMYNYRYYDLNPRRIVSKLFHVSLKQLNQEVHACEVLTEHPGWGPCYKDGVKQDSGAYQIYPDAVREHVKEL